MSEKAERYIKRQTARNVLASIIKDIEKLCGDDKKDEASKVIERIEAVRSGLIGV